MTTRRDALTFLGLAGVSSPALATESLALNQKHSKFPQLGTAVHIKKIAAALRKLADGLESGDVIPEGLSLYSSLGPYPPGVAGPESVSIAELKSLLAGINKTAAEKNDVAAASFAVGRIKRIISESNQATWLEQDLRFRFYLTEEGHADPIEQMDPMA